MKDSLNNTSVMGNYESRMAAARYAIAEADAVLIGAGSGFSTAAGLVYDGEDFHREFADFIARYGITDLYTSSFYPFRTEEERWACWSKHVQMIRYAPPAMPLYLQLLKMVKACRKPYFVITTNVDGQFRKAGFEPDYLFEVQGDYGLMQCQTACHDKLYSNEPAVGKMVASIRDCRIPSDLVPVCPVCGGNMDIHVRKDAYFIEDSAWNTACEHYEKFVESFRQKRIVLLELGVGFNTPTIIRYPFEKITYHNSLATLIRINRDYSDALAENRQRTISFKEDAETVLADLCKEQERTDL